MSDSANVAITYDVRIPMRDGIHLNAVAYKPREQEPPSPCIVAITPYTADGWHIFGVYFAARKMPFVIVDARGRGDSDGVYGKGSQAAKDGYDIVEWVATQSYCNGKVAMYGASDLGYVQWATAKELPPHLATIVPTAAPYIGVDFPMRNNVFYPYLVQWLTLTSGRALQGRLGSDGSFWGEIYRRWHVSGRPFRDLDAILGNPLALFHEWLQHPEPDEYSDAQNPTTDQYSRMQFPILTITGSYDDDQPGALEHYRQHICNALPEARARHFLIIGPWNHGGTQWPVAEFGGLEFGPASVIDIRQLHFEWYRWTLEQGLRPEFLKKRVAYYVMGAERWCYADTLKQITCRHDALFLDSTGSASDVYLSGSLGKTVGKGAPDSYTYDPRETSGPEVEQEANADGTSLTDQSVILALRGRLLVYHSPPLEQDLQVSGFFKLTAWIGIDCPDTDLYVSVHEIDANGCSVRLSTDVMRARYREGLRTPKLIRTQDPLKYVFERFTFVSRLIKRGHCLRLVISPIGRVIEGIFGQKNFNAGGVVSEEFSDQGRAVTVRMFHDEKHPSALHIPIGQAEEL